MTQVTGPNFLCIGLQKAGTGWLYDQLQFHPDFWMPPIKEFHYFDRDFPDRKLRESIALQRDAASTLVKKRARRGWRALDERDLAFFTDAEALVGSGIDIDRYADLFRHKGALLSGDVTPAYSTLSEDLVARITQRLPRAQVLLLLRDPIARVFSQISMSWRRGKFQESTLHDAAALRRHLESPNVTQRSFPTRIHARWARHVSAGQLRFFFLDDIISEPERTRSEILAFLGADPNKASGSVAPGFNRKSEQQKLELTSTAEQVLIEHFAEELRACVTVFGGPARRWLERYQP